MTPKDELWQRIEIAKTSHPVVYFALSYAKQHSLDAEHTALIIADQALSALQATQNEIYKIKSGQSTIYFESKVESCGFCGGTGRREWHLCGNCNGRGWI